MGITNYIKLIDILALINFNFKFVINLIFITLPKLKRTNINLKTQKVFT